MAQCNFGHSCIAALSVPGRPAYKGQATMPEDVRRHKSEPSGAASESENERKDTGQVTDNGSNKMTDQRSVPEGADANANVNANGEAKKKYDPKDPLRPRRKKARRACLACQRAHLTCGKLMSRLYPLCLPLVFPRLASDSSFPGPRQREGEATRPCSICAPLSDWAREEQPCAWFVS